MAIGDLTAEEQVLEALYAAQNLLLADYISPAVRAAVLTQIREAIKRVQEARHE